MGLSWPVLGGTRTSTPSECLQHLLDMWHWQVSHLNLLQWRVIGWLLLTNTHTHSAVIRTWWSSVGVELEPWQSLLALLFCWQDSSYLGNGWWSPNETSDHPRLYHNGAQLQGNIWLIHKGLDCYGNMSALTPNLCHLNPLVLQQDNAPFSKEVTRAEFYYLDKFVLLVTGNRVGLYKYHIGDGHQDDIKRSEQKPLPV